MELDQLGFAAEQKIAYDRAEVQECMRENKSSPLRRSASADSQGTSVPLLTGEKASSYLSDIHTIFNKLITMYRQ